MGRAVASGVFLFVLVAVVALLGHLRAAAAEPVNVPPAMVSLDECEFRIVAMDFVEAFETDRFRVSEPEPDKFRYAVVTVEIRKPRGMALELCTADLTLHYWRSNGEYDVALCRATSQITTRLDEDRLMAGARGLSPGWVKSRTGTATRRASKVHVDLVFAKIESDISTAWLFVGQPIGNGLRCQGW